MLIAAPVAPSPAGSASPRAPGREKTPQNIHIYQGFQESDPLQDSRVPVVLLSPHSQQCCGTREKLEPQLPALWARDAPPAALLCWLCGSSTGLCTHLGRGTALLPVSSLVKGGWIQPAQSHQSISNDNVQQN